MVLPFTILFGALGYLYYKSKEELTLVENDNNDPISEDIYEDDLYKDLEDLFI